MTQRLKTAAAVVLGMHDALVSLTGMIGGLTFALADRRMIILSAVIASVAAGLSMAASCYLAEKTNDNPHALRTGLMTGVAYLGTCAFLILPFFVVPNTHTALAMSFVMAVLIIFGCNWCIGRVCARTWWKRAIEMLIICAGVSIVSFAIGEFAQYALGIMI
ncbi:MAG: VIT1/CCC1 transporter family protein [Alphaproteobacteria bacterium]|nr:VIT1/CCC1 transporter family protein [Alphaproteobacteria bacterium]